MVPCRLTFLLCYLTGSLYAVTLQIHGGACSVTIQGEDRDTTASTTFDQRPSEANAKPTVEAGNSVIECQPPATGLDVRVPLSAFVEVDTTSGDISTEGLIRSMRITTQTGGLRLRAPWYGTPILVDASAKPASLHLAPGFKFRQRSSEGRWLLRNEFPETRASYGDYRVLAGELKHLVLEDYTVPPAFPLQFPWQAGVQMKKFLDPARQSSMAPSAPASNSAAPADSSGIAVFRSDVRIVNLVVAANHPAGGAVTGLTATDFTVTEDGIPQTVSFAGADEVPFHLGILLDLSGSTHSVRDPMKEAARRFVSMARPIDEVAIYVLADGMFQVLSPLTRDHRRVLDRLESLATPLGGSPVYDAITLGLSAQQGTPRGERNALIVLSDGLDNQFDTLQTLPSTVRFRDLEKLAEAGDVLVYPIFLRSAEDFGRRRSNRAREQMERLAMASRGRMFPARSISDLEPVFPLVSEELRSVYSVAYYPKNQNFDGKWRQIEVRVRRSDVEVRVRPGYFAR